MALWPLAKAESIVFTIDHDGGFSHRKDTSDTNDLVIEDLEGRIPGLFTTVRRCGLREEPPQGCRIGVAISFAGLPSPVQYSGQWPTPGSAPFNKCQLPTCVLIAQSELKPGLFQKVRLVLDVQADVVFLGDARKADLSSVASGFVSDQLLLCTRLLSVASIYRLVMPPAPFTVVFGLGALQYRSLHIPSANGVIDCKEEFTFLLSPEMGRSLPCLSVRVLGLDNAVVAQGVADINHLEPLDEWILDLSLKPKGVVKVALELNMLLGPHELLPESPKEEPEEDPEAEVESPTRIPSAGPSVCQPLRHSGYLQKMQMNKFGLYHKRWFDLTGTTLSYFKAEGDAKPLKQVDLTCASVTSVPDNAAFETVVTIEVDGGQRLTLRSDQDDMQRWLEVITKAQIGDVRRRRAHGEKMRRIRECRSDKVGSPNLKLHRRIREMTPHDESICSTPPKPRDAMSPGAPSSMTLTDGLSPAGPSSATITNGASPGGPPIAITNGMRPAGPASNTLPATMISGASPRPLRKIHKLAAEGDVAALQEALAAGGSSVDAPDESGHAALIAAARTGHIACVAALLQAQADVNRCKAPGQTALYLAAQRGHVEVVDTLLRHQADPNATTDTGDSPLLIAADSGAAGCVDLLIKAGAALEHRDHNGDNALALAAYRGRAGALRVLLAARAEVDPARGTGTTPLLLAAEGGQVECAQLLIEAGANVRHADANGTTAAHRAAHKGHAAVLRTLLAASAEVDCRRGTGSTPLLLAAEFGHPACVTVLLEHGAGLDHRDRKGSTALFLAAQTGTLEIARQLLKALADPDAARDSGTTPLMAAAYNAHDGVVQALLQGNAAPDARRTDGATALHLAAREGWAPVLKTLLAARADVEAECHDGATALLGAVEANRVECARRLLQARADPEHADGDGETPLLCACRAGHAAIVRELLLLDVKMSVAPDEDGPLLTAARYNRPDCVDALLRARADVQQRGEGGTTALHAAAQIGSLPVVRMLLAAKASVQCTTDAGLTPLDVAREARRDAVAELLQASVSGSPAASPDQSPRAGTS